MVKMQAYYTGGLHCEVKHQPSTSLIETDAPKDNMGKGERFFRGSIPSHLHSIEHYYARCEELAKDCPEDVMVLRDEITRITGWYWTIGWPAQNCADTDGYVDVRTGKKYPYGKSSFCEDIK
ncbi:MAG: hypothetical protein EBZ49_10715 [Proteobacteria bacterium]|nr:hypothetical protein [Pseudomonadota bacterium]